MKFSLHGGQLGQLKKLNFSEIKESFIYTWKALNHLILINEMKLMRSFSLRVVTKSLLLK